ncbi:MAG: oxidoreductase, partial [Muribaculaceae bacterium]|nr:oxidoreductase [Muribaculaceae bacterium]
QLRFTDIRPGFIATDLLDSTTRYPMIMQPEYAIKLIVKAIERGRRVAYIDRRWGLLVRLWRLLPSWLWVRIKATTSKK